jgi:hypothetical protein
MSQNHAKTQKLSLVAVPEKDGKVRVMSQSRDNPLTTFLGRGPGIQCQQDDAP